MAVEERGGEDLDDDRRMMAATGNRGESYFLFIIRQQLFLLCDTFSMKVVNLLDNYWTQSFNLLKVETSERAPLSLSSVETAASCYAKPSSHDESNTALLLRPDGSIQPTKAAVTQTHLDVPNKRSPLCLDASPRYDGALTTIQNGPLHSSGIRRLPALLPLQTPLVKRFVCPSSLQERARRHEKEPRRRCR